VSQAQYSFPVDFSSTDSLQFRGDTKAFAGQFGVHFGDIPGFVFQTDREFPRIRFFYQQDAAVAISPGASYADQSRGRITDIGLFTGMGNITPNLELIGRYNVMTIGGKSAVLNGYGARYRTALGTDSLHSLATGFLLQKLAGSSDVFLKSLDFNVAYGWYFPSYILTFDGMLSYVSGQVNLQGNPGIPAGFNPAFSHRVLQFGVGFLTHWKGLSLGCKFRTNLGVYNFIGYVGWSFPGVSDHQTIPGTLTE